MDRGRSVRGWIACGLGALCTLFGLQMAEAATCDTAALDAVYSGHRQLTGNQRLRITIRVPRLPEVGVTVLATGVDARVEAGVDGDRGATSQRVADNPVRRWGPRRLVVSTGGRTTVAIVIIGKEKGGARGDVRLKVARIPSTTALAACSSAFRRIASGDEHYARAELAVLGTPVVPGDDARKEYLASAKDYQQAAGVLSGVGVNPMLAQAQLSTAAAYYQGVQDWTEAEGAAHQATEYFKALKDVYGIARARAMRAAAAMEIALQSGTDKQHGKTALEAVRHTFDDVALLHAQRHERFDEALALNNVGLAYYYAGELESSLKAYRKAETLYTRLAETSRQAQVRQNIAVVEYEMGRLTDATHDFTQDLDLIDRGSNPTLYAAILNNRALAEYGSGEVDGALKDYGAALVTLSAIQSAREEARSLQGLGMVYYAVGNRSEAINYFRRALALRTSASDPRGRVTSLRSLANALSDEGQATEALSLHQEALGLSIPPSTRLRIAAQIASDLDALGEGRKASEALARALGDTTGASQSARAFALLERARLEYGTHDYSNARQDARAALEIYQSAESPADAFAALLVAAHIAQAQADNSDAGHLADEALGMAERVRLQSSNLELRAGLWRSARPAFDFKIQLLAQSRGTHAEVGEAVIHTTLLLAEQSRARALADYRARRLAATPRQAPNSARTGQELSFLYREIAERRFQLDARLDRAAEDDPRVSQIRADIAELERRVDILNRSAVDRNTSGTGPSRIATTVDHEIEMIPADAAVIEYWLGKDTAWAWVIKARSLRMFCLGSSHSIESAVTRLLGALRNLSSVPMERREQLAMDLYALVIAPLPADVLTAKTLFIIPDGALHYIPFAVLGVRTPSGIQYLLDEHDIVTTPSLTTLGNSVHPDPPRHPDRALIVSDPVYSATDERVHLQHPSGSEAPATMADEGSLRLRGAGGNAALERLPSTAREASSISTLLPGTRIDTLSGLDATRARFLALDLSQYRIIHVAAHGISDAVAPGLSALILTQVDAMGRGIPGEVFSGELLLRKVNAQLVVLSACDTALGPEYDGEGLLGLRYAVHAAGAQNVVASLWQTPDRTAADLMTGFYIHLVRDQKSPAAALSEAMRTVEQRYRDPALWGAFQISVTGGEWHRTVN